MGVVNVLSSKRGVGKIWYDDYADNRDDDYVSSHDDNQDD